MIEYCQLLQCATSSVFGGMVIGAYLGLAARVAAARREGAEGKGPLFRTNRCDFKPMRVIRCLNSGNDASPNRAILGAILRTEDQARIEISEPASSTLFLLIYKSGSTQSQKKPFNVENGVVQLSRIVAQDDCIPTFSFLRRLLHTAPANTNTMRMRAPIS